MQKMNSKINSSNNNMVCSSSSLPEVPNPAPLGLIAFGLTTALLQVKHSRLGGDSAQELSGVDVEVMGFALFFGGLLQVRGSESRCRPMFPLFSPRLASTFCTLDLGRSK
jgi:succinate-acetate transporter protein